MSRYIECDSERCCRSQDVIEAGEPFASVVDRVRERSENALHDEEHKHGDDEQNLAGDSDLVSGSDVAEETIVRADNSCEKQGSQFSEKIG